MSGKRSLQRLISMLGLALVASFAITSTAVAQPCDPEEANWVASQYYTKDTVVYHNDRWYQARAFSEGKEPGITFQWKELDKVPDCGKQNPESVRTDPPETKMEAKSGNTTGGTPQDSGSSLCVRPEHWRFSHSYTQGDLVSHGGKVWKAANATAGDMPGMAESPRWQLVPDHCSMKLD